MSKDDPKSPSPEQLARLNRLRHAREDHARSMHEVLDDAIAVRANMARLRALRLAKEAQQVRTEFAKRNHRTKRR
jgi:hypothetical protein